MKSAKGLYEFFRDKLPAERKYYDLIPALLWRKPSLTGLPFVCWDPPFAVTRELTSRAGCGGIIEAAIPKTGGDIDGDPCQRHTGAGGELTVLDIDNIIE